MARQWFDIGRNAFWLDLHGVLTADATRAIEKRIGECRRFGIGDLYVIYGTPNSYEGSIAKRLWRITNQSLYIDHEGIPVEFLNQPDRFSTRVPELRLPIRRAPSVCPSDEQMSFVGFRASRERDHWKRRLCEMRFAPLKKWFDLTEVAAFAGPKYTTERVSAVLDSFRPSDLVIYSEYDRLFIASHHLEDIVTLLWRQDTYGAQRTYGTQNAAIPVEAHDANQVANASLLEFEQMWQPAVEALNSRDYARAEPLLECCLSNAEKHFPHHQRLPAVLGCLAQCYSATGKGNDADDFFQLALDWNGQPVETWSHLRADIGTDFAAHLQSQSNLTGAASVWREIRADMARAGDREGELTALSNEADIRSELGDYAAADALYRQAVVIARERNETPVDVLAPLLFELGRTCATLCKQKEALPLFREAMSLSDDPELLESCRFKSAQIYFDAGELGKARRLLTEIVEKARVLAASSENYLWALYLLGRIHLHRAELEMAELCFAEVLERLSEHGTTDGKLVWSSYFWAAKVYETAEKRDRAQANYEKVVASLEKDRDADGQILFRALLNLSVLYSDSDRRTDAVSVLLKAIRVLQEFAQTFGHRTAADMYDALGVHFANLSEFTQAEKQFRKALCIKDAVETTDCESIAKTQLLLAKALLAQSRFNEARPVCKRAIDLLESERRRSTETQQLLASGYAHIGAALRGMGNEKGAERMFNHAAEHGRPEYGSKDPIPLGVRRQLFFPVRQFYHSGEFQDSVFLT